MGCHYEIHQLRSLKCRPLNSGNAVEINRIHKTLKVTSRSYFQPLPVSSMESLAKFFNAAVVLPLTAGEASENHHSTDNLRSHDGSISGLILLSSVLVITVLSMFGVQLVDSEKNETMTYLSIYSYLCVVIFLAIVVCIAHLINYRLRHADILTTAGNVNANFKVKFLFLWIFAIGSILFTVAKIISTVRCKEKTFDERKKEGCEDKNSTYDTSYEIAKVSFHCTEIIFYVIQSWFLQFCIRCCFKCSWRNYYSLLLIVLANISQWAHYFAEIYQNSAGNSRNCAINNKCYPHIIYEKIKPYAHPLQMEYFLLSMILIAELWPTNQNHGYALPSSNPATRHGNESTPLLSPLTHLLPITASMEASIESRNLLDRQPKGRSLNLKAVACITVGVAIVVPCYIFGSITISERLTNAGRENVTNRSMSAMEITDVAYDMFLTIFVITLLIISFYMFSQSSSLKAVMCSVTMETLAKFFNAAIVLPFTAGEPSETSIAKIIFDLTMAKSADLYKFQACL
ncbi:unnamed protein product [Mytilus coruscus]|uniref:Uncharacterized protein n=1 Tax=Mytilus coruscus TaxID=42192 RepID=A0A6J8CR87_MYTCO|nr:unnamed protein product [Mytilus coruscus]